MNGTITNDSKLTVSLTAKQWVALIGTVLVIGLAGYRLEMGRREAAKFKVTQESVNAKKDLADASQDRRLARVERKVGIKRSHRARHVAVQEQDDDEDSGWFWQN